MDQEDDSDFDDAFDNPEPVVIKKVQKMNK